MTKYKQAQDTDTVLHAITGPEAGHGPLWKAASRRVGAMPRIRVYESEAG